MSYLIDTDWIISFLVEEPDAVAIIRELADERIAISVLTYMEVFQGIERCTNPADARVRLQELVSAIPVLPVSTAVARCCARLRNTLREEGKESDNRAIDLLIAATALEHDLVLVTKRPEYYAGVHNLSLRESK